MDSRQTSVLVVGGLTLVAAALRLFGLDEPLWYDEIVTLVDFVRPPLIELLTQPAHANNHPLYSVAAQVSVGAFGESAWSLRLPAVVAGVASIPVLYLLGVMVTSRVEAILAAALLTVSYHHIWFSQNARGYTGLALWTMLATMLLLRALDRDEMRWWVGHGLVLTLGLYTHLTMAMVAASHALICAWVLGYERKEGPTSRMWLRPATSFLLAAGIAGVLYLPLATGVVESVADSSGGAAEVTRPGRAVWEALRGLQLGLGFWGLLAAGILAALGVLSYIRRSQVVAAMFLLPGALMGATIVFLHYPARPRFLFFLIGFFALFVTRGAMVAVGASSGRKSESESVPRRLAYGTALIVVLILMSAISLAAVWGPKQDFGAALDYVESERAPAEPVATTGPAEFPYLNYYRTGWDALKTRADFDALRAGGQRVWVVYTLPAHVEPEVRAALEENCPPARNFPGTVGGGDVVVCVTAPAHLPPDPK